MALPIHIRSASYQDRADIRAVYLSAFDDDEKEIVSDLAVNLLIEKTMPRTISLVAIAHGAVVGHIAFSPVQIEGDNRPQGYILAPLAVKPQNQKCRIGSNLIKSGLRQLQKMGVDIVFVYGDPQYYSRLGFSTEIANRYTPPYTLQYPFGWQAIALDDNCAAASSGIITCVASLCDPSLW
jgi:putative acetyltransferase